MKFIETRIQDSKNDIGALKLDLFYLRQIGIRDLLIPGYFALRDFHEASEEIDFSCHLNVITYPNRDSIKMAWSILRSYDSFTLLVQCMGSAISRREYKESLYQAFSLTDEVGCLVNAEAILDPNAGERIEDLQKEFELQRFLIKDSQGSLFPEEISRISACLRKRTTEDSSIFFYPNNGHGMGMLGALYAIKEGFDGLAGSAILKNDRKNIDFSALYRLYLGKREELFPRDLMERVDRAFEFASKIGRGAEPSDKSLM
jgi:hypothetical protein